MNIFPLNTSQYSMWMNEKSFPKEAINTISFRLYFPDQEAAVVKMAADTVINSCDLFRLRFMQDAEEKLFLEKTADPVHCSELERERSLSETGKLCEILETQKIVNFSSGNLYQAKVFPVREGGSLLLFLFHHILTDGYGMCQIAQMVLDNLNGRESQQVCREFKETDVSKKYDGEEEKRFWISYFDQVQAEGELFHEEAEGCSRTCYSYTLSGELTNQICSYADAHGITPASVFSGAFALYLARAGKSKDAVYLMPRLNRETPEERRQMGCYTLVVPVRVTVDNKMKFSELCQAAYLSGKKASAHKNYGISNIIKDLHGSGIISGNISEYTLNYYQPELRSEIPFEIHMSMDGAMHNHLTANITKFKKVFQIDYDGRDGIYTEERVKYFHEALLAIIRQGMNGADKEVGSFQVTGERERERLLHMEGKKIQISETDTIPSLFEKAAEKYGEKPALYAKDVCLTFRELDLMSNRIANGLIQKGIRMGETVMYMLNRDYRLLPAMFGILKAGAAFIPVDPQYPRGRIEYILENSGSSYIISSKDVEAAGEISYLEVDELLSFEKDSDPRLSIPQEQLAYCIYTSGTTGNPKGVMLSHRGIVNITHPDNNPFNRDIVTCGTGITAIGSVCFDISLFEFFVPLFNGMFIELAPDDALADPVKLAGLIRAHGANILHCTPSRLSAYLHEKSFAEALAFVQVILAAGEVLPGSLTDELREDYGIRIYNGYGPTETTIGATITEAGDNLTIGTPIANTGILILDEEGRLLPYGATGEICIYGKGLGIGYKGLEKETALRFVERYGKRVYRTGDLGAFLKDGRLLYSGRNDQQVKIRGLRIEPAEIENCIRAFPGIGSACVIVRTLAGTPHLVGFYTVKQGAAAAEPELRSYLKGRLTSYMVPDILKELEDIPQTPGGKTDLKALEQEPIEYVRTWREPENSFQRAICEAFAAVLGEEKIGLDDNFFELGGDSLHTAELISEIEERLPKVQMVYGDVFRYPTPDMLAQYLYRPDSGREVFEDSLKNLDYRGLDKILGKNIPGGTKSRSLGNVLLTGATGFLGIHILLELLEQPWLYEKIYCLVRPTKRLDETKRLRSTLFYFGDNDYGEEFGNRLFALNGDIAEESIFVEPFKGKIDTVINCAANVAHFAYDDKLEQINTVGVRNLLDFCKKQKASLLQISTISVGGVSPKKKKTSVLTEQDLYIGQEIHNQYILSKYMAEYEILRRAADEGIPVRIMRVGNLQGRMRDGEFQMNRRTNAFTRQISAYVKIGKVPAYVYNSSVNFSPVDEVAKMIVALAALEEEYSVFHVYPPQEVPYRKLFETLESIGYPVEQVSDEEFDRCVKTMGQSREGKRILEGILLENADLRYTDNKVTQEFTENMLTRLNLKWKPVTDSYLTKYFTALEELQMFEREEE